MNLGEVDVPYVVSGIVVANLSASPVYTFNFDGFSRLDDTVPTKVSILAIPLASLELYTGLSGCQRFWGVQSVCVCCGSILRC
jgi:hypothetical protein